MMRHCSRSSRSLFSMLLMRRLEARLYDPKADINHFICTYSVRLLVWKFKHMWRIFFSGHILILINDCNPYESWWIPFTGRLDDVDVENKTKKTNRNYVIKLHSWTFYLVISDLNHLAESIHLLKQITAWEIYLKNPNNHCFFALFYTQHSSLNRFTEAQ